MAVALRNGASGALEQFKSGESLQIDQLERLAGSGHLVIGSALGATDELQLGSVASVVRILGDFDVDGAMAGDLDMNGNDILNAGNLVTMVFGRVGSVSAAASDYDASQVDNDSSVPGTYVDNALDTLLSAVSACAPESRSLTAGAGLTGGGNLSADRTFDVVANADGSVVVNADDIQVGVLASDVQHGARGGGIQHAVVSGSAAGFAPTVSSIAGALAYSTSSAQAYAAVLRAILSPAALEIGASGAVATSGALRFAKDNSLLAALNEAEDGIVKMIEKDPSSDAVNIGPGASDIVRIGDVYIEVLEASGHPAAPTDDAIRLYTLSSGTEFWAVKKGGDRVQLV